MATRLTLHEAMIDVLTRGGQALSPQGIAAEVNRLGLYARHDDAPVLPHQIGARAHNYPDLFSVANGMIALPPLSSGTRSTTHRINRDYRALGQYFRTLSVDEVRLRFSDIEEILDAPLQTVARRHDTFWQNSNPSLPKPDGHEWAHEWMKAGWRMIAVDRHQEAVVFRRVGEPTLVNPLDAIRPRRLELIYDILQRIPISVDAWHRTKSGRPPKSVKANPQFCYNWSFGTPKEGYAVCFWHDNLDVSSDGKVFSETNYRASADSRRRRADGLPASDRERARLIAQAERGEALDKAIEITSRLRRPLHVILCYRDDHGRGSSTDRAPANSSVKLRELDSVTWSVLAYDEATGACRVARGASSAAEVKNEGPASEGDPKDRVARYMNVEIRQDQPAFRRAVFAAYSGRCAISGCDIPEALEAAHLHGRNWRLGDNAATDGILLRRDLHALYDRGLLELSKGIARFDSGVVHHYAHLEGTLIAEGDRN